MEVVEVEVVAAVAVAVVVAVAQWRRVTCTPTPTLSAAEIPYSWGTTYAAIVRAAWYSSGSARRLRWALWITCEWGEMCGVNRNCAGCE